MCLCLCVCVGGVVIIWNILRSIYCIKDRIWSATWGDKHRTVFYLFGTVSSVWKVLPFRIVWLISGHYQVMSYFYLPTLESNSMRVGIVGCIVHVSSFQTSKLAPGIGWKSICEQTGLPFSLILFHSHSHSLHSMATWFKNHPLFSTSVGMGAKHFERSGSELLYFLRPNEASLWVFPPPHPTPILIFFKFYSCGHIRACAFRSRRGLHCKL